MAPENEDACDIARRMIFALTVLISHAHPKRTRHYHFRE
jgi:hypothetical protein